MGVKDYRQALKVDLKSGTVRIIGFLDSFLSPNFKIVAVPRQCQ